MLTDIVMSDMPICCSGMGRSRRVAGTSYAHVHVGLPHFSKSDIALLPSPIIANDCKHADDDSSDTADESNNDLATNGHTIARNLDDYPWDMRSDANHGQADYTTSRQPTTTLTRHTTTTWTRPTSSFMGINILSTTLTMTTKAFDLECEIGSLNDAQERLSKDGVDTAIQGLSTIRITRARSSQQLDYGDDDDEELGGRIRRRRPPRTTTIANTRAATTVTTPTNMRRMHKRIDDAYDGNSSEHQGARLNNAV
ncbi:hypothetical protein BDZ89DRAFT_1037099 [Hymenopellis radicata]|nr:hypothetical protein BDZ89DRAFT_1037099 [Hymenopellis radicata]